MNLKIKFELPKKIEKVIMKDNYKKNTKYSVSQMIKEPRAVVLEARYGDKVQDDLDRRLWSFTGTALHNALEADEFATDNESLTEIRLKYSKMSGKFDHYDAKNKILYDFKQTSKFKVLNATEKSLRDYQIQLSLYAWLLEREGFEVKQIANIIFMRDWHKRDRFKLPEKFATIYHDILTEIDELPIQQWIDKRIETFDKYMNIPDNELPYCSEEFRWAEPDVFAVMKNKNKNATRLLDTREQAEQYIANIKDTKNKYWIQERQGNKFKRCEYCSISEYCNQYKEGKNEKV
jgi:CRISPR/Cas system-associated exonuclease Cas4 (RecB family)